MIYGISGAVDFPDIGKSGLSVVCPDSRSGWQTGCVATVSDFETDILPCPLAGRATIGRQGGSLYADELSLVCDQRYSKDDMNRIVEMVREFFGEQ